jgi:nucleosome assembly protein 1-like 1
MDLPAEIIEQFGKRVEEMKDEDYDKLEVTPCDVKSIQNIPKGVSDFWVKAMLNHPPLAGMITEKDRPILGYLANIELDLHEGEKGEGYDLIFTFLPNNYFNGTVLKKELNMKDKNILEKTTGTNIDWKDGCNPCLKKTKKKKGKKKVNVTVKCDSFFNFFNDIDPETEKDKKDDKKEEKEEKEEDFEDVDDEDDDLQDKLQEELELADQFKDDLVPLALEYYLGVIDAEDEDSDDDEDGNGDGDSDSDGGNKKKKKGKKGNQDLPLGPDGKPQECKQQ